MQTYTKKISLVAASCVLSLCVGVQSAHAWTFTVSGTIRSGFDNVGAFGGGDLTGKSFTEVFNVDPALYSTQISSIDSSNNVGFNSGTVTETVTVGGFTHTYDFTGSSNQAGVSFLSTGLTNGTGISDEVYQFLYGTVSSGETVNSSGFLFSQLMAPLGNSTSFQQTYSNTISHPILGPGNNYYYGGGQFTLTDSGNNEEVNFVGNVYLPVTVTINQVSAVPEPETYAMLLAGLGLVGAIASRRRKQKAKHN